MCDTSQMAFGYLYNKDVTMGTRNKFFFLIITNLLLIVRVPVGFWMGGLQG